jgi:hypothetical protein
LVGWSWQAAKDHLLMPADRAEPAPQPEHQRLLKRARHGEAVGTSGLLVERDDGRGIDS